MKFTVDFISTCAARWEIGLGSINHASTIDCVNKYSEIVLLQSDCRSMIKNS